MRGVNFIKIEEEVNMSDYNGITAKTMAMKGKLLKKEDYFLLAQTGTVAGFMNKLAEYEAYAPLFAGASDLHRGEAEQKLRLSLADDFEKIYAYVGDMNLRAYLSAYYEKPVEFPQGSFELENKTEIITMLIYGRRKKNILTKKTLH